jgi:hypothetical protein
VVSKKFDEDKKQQTEATTNKQTAISQHPRKDYSSTWQDKTNLFIQVPPGSTTAAVVRVRYYLYTHS